MPRILFVSGFHPATRARDLAYEFERYGNLVRCDVPAPRNPHAHSNPYAFVEFRSQRDAEDAYYEMHGRYFEGSRLSIQWAKNPPSSVWRYDRRASPPPRASRNGRDRSRSPRRRPERDDRYREGDREYSDRDRDRDRDREYDRERGGDRRRRSRSPDRDREREREYRTRRSASPDRRKDERDTRDKARTPPPPEDGPKETVDRAKTPPYDHRE